MTSTITMAMIAIIPVILKQIFVSSLLEKHPNLFLPKVGVGVGIIIF